MTLIIGTDADTNDAVKIEYDDLTLGTAIIGKTGSGKSALLSHMIQECVRQGTCSFVFDPHGDLCRTVINTTPRKFIDNLVLIDIDPSIPFHLNPFYFANPAEILAVDNNATNFVTLFKKILGMTERQILVDRVLQNIATVLIENQGHTLLDVPKLLQEKPFRNTLLHQVTNAAVVRYWQQDYEHTYADPRARSEEINPVLRRIGMLTEQNFLYRIFARPEPTIKFGELLHTRKVYLLNLSQLSESNIELLGTILLFQLACSIYARAGGTKRPRVELFIDEYGKFALSDITANLLLQGRKFECATTCVIQVLASLPDEKNKGAFFQAGNIVSFQAVGDDALEIAKNLDCTPPAVPERQLAVPQNIIDQLVSSHTSHPNPEVRELITKVLASQREKVEEARAAPSYDPWLKAKEGAALARLRFLNRLLRDVLERRLLPTDKDFLNRVHGADPDHPQPKPPEPTKTPEAMLYQTVSAFTSEEAWEHCKQHYRQFWLDMTFQATIDQPSSTGTGMTTRQVSFQPFQTDADLQAATPTQLLALLKFKLLLMRDTSVFPFLKNSLARRLPKAEREQAIRDTFTQLARDARLYESWDQKLNKERERESLYGTPTFPPVNKSFFTGRVYSLTILPFAGLTSLSQEYEGCCLVGFSEDHLLTLIETIRTYPDRPLEEALYSTHILYWQHACPSDVRTGDETHIPIIKAQLIDLLNRYGAAVLIAEYIYQDAASRVSHVNTISANEPVRQISGRKSQIDLLRSINQLALTIARNLASEVDFSEPVKHRLLPSASDRDIKRAIEDELFRRTQLRALIASEHIELVALLHKELTAADADIRACVQPFLETDPLVAAYLIARAHALVASGSNYANHYYPEPHLPGIPAQTVQQTIAALVNRYDEREGLGRLLHYWTQQTLFSVLVVHLPASSVRLPAELEDLRRLCELLAEDKNREPLLVPAGYDAVPERPLTYADMSRKIANNLANLPKFTMLCQFTTKQGVKQRTVKLKDELKWPKEEDRISEEEVRQAGQALFGKPWQPGHPGATRTDNDTKPSPEPPERKTWEEE